MRSALDDAEARCTKLELSKRALEGDIQRTKLVVTDKETEIHVITTTFVCCDDCVIALSISPGLSSSL